MLSGMRLEVERIAMNAGLPIPCDKLLRKREVADRLACSVRTVEREVISGNLERVKVRGGVRFRESEVNRIINGKIYDLQS